MPPRSREEYLEWLQALADHRAGPEDAEVVQEEQDAIQAQADLEARLLSLEGVAQGPSPESQLAIAQQATADLPFRQRVVHPAATALRERAANVQTPNEMTREQLNAAAAAGIPTGMGGGGAGLATILDMIGSMGQTASDPVRDLQENPLEAVFNLADLATPGVPEGLIAKPIAAALGPFVGSGMRRLRQGIDSLLPSPTSGSDFVRQVGEAKATHPLGFAVDEPSVQAAEDAFLFNPVEGAGALVTPGGDLESVFRGVQAQSQDVQNALDAAVPGALTADAFDVGGMLPNLYREKGMVPVARVKFDPQFAPPGFDAEALSSRGLTETPDVVLLVNDPNDVLGVPHADYNDIRETIPVFENWDDAAAAQKSASESIMGASPAPGEKVMPTDTGLGRFRPGEVEGTSAKARGKHSGAPAGVRGPKTRQARVDGYLAQVEKGASMANWYRDASGDILKAAGGRSAVADRFGGAVGATSANTSLGPNLNAGTKLFNQASMGRELSGHMPAVNDKVGQIFKGEEGLQFGPKISPYLINLRQAWDPQASRAVHDIWDARAWGFNPAEVEGLGEAQHRWMDEMTTEAIDQANRVKLGGKDDWDVDSIQAAAWMSKRADEGGFDLADWQSGYAGHIPERTARLDLESLPNEVAEDVLRTPEGQSVISQQALGLTPEEGIQQAATTRPGSPDLTSPILVGQETGGAAMDPASEELLRSIAGAEGLARGQSEVRGSFTNLSKATQGNANAVTVPGYSAANIDELQALADVQLGPGRAFAEVTPQGQVTMVAIDPQLAGKELQQFSDIASGQSVSPDLRTPSGAPKRLPGPQPQSRGVPARVDEFTIGGPDFKPSELVSEIAPIAEERLDQIMPALARNLTASGFQFTDPVRQATWEALAQGGIGRVRQLVEQGILPAAVLGVLMSMQATEGPDGSI